MTGGDLRDGGLERGVCNERGRLMYMSLEVSKRVSAWWISANE
jgi:hypothetical protein